MQQVTLAASIVGILMLAAFAGTATYFDRGPFDTPLDSLYGPLPQSVALRQAG